MKCLYVIRGVFTTLGCMGLLGMARSVYADAPPSPAFVQAIATARTGQTVVIPAGEYTIATIRIPSGVSVCGSGTLATQLTIAPGGAGLVCDHVQGANISNLHLINTANTAVTISHANRVRVQRLLINEGMLAVKVADSAEVVLANVVANHCQAGIAINGCRKTGVVNNTLYGQNITGLSISGSTDCVAFNNALIEVSTGTALGEGNTRVTVDHNLYKTLFVGSMPGQGRYTVGAWSSVSHGQDRHSVQLPVELKDPAHNDFTPTATLSWDPSRATVSGWGVNRLQGIAAPTDDLRGQQRTGAIPDVGAVLPAPTKPAPYAGYFNVSRDDGRKSAGLFTPNGVVVRYLFQDMPLKKGHYGYVLPSYDQYGHPIVPGRYEVRVAEGQLTLQYLTLSANNGGKNSDLNADSDSTRRVAFSPTGDLLIGMGWGERYINLISIDPSYRQPGRWAFKGQSDILGLCDDGKVIYFAKSWTSGNTVQFLLTRIDPATGQPVPWDATTPVLTLPMKQLGAVNSMACLDGKLYLADGAGRIVSGDTARPACTDAFPAEAPESLTADSRHHLLWYVSHQRTVVAVDPAGHVMATLTQWAHPLAVAVAGNRMAVADAKTGKVYLYRIDDPTHLTLLRSYGSGDGPYGPYAPTRFRFQEFNGVAQSGCVLALTEDGRLALFDKYVSVFDADGRVLHGSYAHFGNAPRMIQGTTDGKVHFFDSNGHLTWVDDPRTYTWQPGGLYYLPEGISGNCIGAFSTQGKLFAAYEQNLPTEGSNKQDGMAIVRFDGYIGRTVSWYTQSRITHQFVVVHDENNDGKIDFRDGDGTPVTPQPPFLTRFWRAVEPDGSIRVMERTAPDYLGIRFTFTGLDAQQRPLYSFSPANFPRGKTDAYGSVYRPDQLPTTMRTGSGTGLMPDGGMITGAFDPYDPMGMTTSNSGSTNLARFARDGTLLWLLPLNDYTPVQGVVPLGNFLLTGWGHQAEWIGLDTDGLQLGHLSFPPEGEWSGYWLDHPGHWTAFDNPDGSVSITAGDYMRNGQHWMRLTGAHTYVKHAYPVTLTARSFLPEAPEGKKMGWVISARAEQPRVTIKKLAAPMPIDGDMEKWRNAGVNPQIAILPNCGTGIKGPQDCSAVVRLAYEGHTLYCQVIRFDDVITQHQPFEKSYLQDTIEMMVNGFMTGFQFSVGHFTDIGDGIVRRRFFFNKLDMPLSSEHCPAKVTVYDSPKDIPERSIIEGLYGVDLSRDKVMVSEYKLPIDDITYQGDTQAEFPVASGKSVWIGFMLDDNDVPGTDCQNYCFWPATYTTFADKEVSAYCTFE